MAAEEEEEVGAGEEGGGRAGAAATGRRLHLLDLLRLERERERDSCFRIAVHSFSFSPSNV